MCMGLNFYKIHSQLIWAPTQSLISLLDTEQSTSFHLHTIMHPTHLTSIMYRTHHSSEEVCQDESTQHQHSTTGQEQLLFLLYIYK